VPAAEVPYPGSVEDAPVAAPAASGSAKPVAASVHQLVAVAVAAEAASLPAAAVEAAWLPEVGVVVVLKDAVRAQQPAASAA
jgi:hypothetical protein